MTNPTDDDDDAFENGILKPGRTSRLRLDMRDELQTEVSRQQFADAVVQAYDDHARCILDNGQTISSSRPGFAEDPTRRYVAACDKKGEALAQAYADAAEADANAWCAQDFESYPESAEGSTCTINGFPGHVKHGKCEADNRAGTPTGVPKTDAMPEEIMQLQDAKQRAYAIYDWETANRLR